MDVNKAASLITPRTRAIQFPHYLLLSEKEQLDYIVGFIEELK